VYSANFVTVKKQIAYLFFILVYFIPRVNGQEIDGIWTGNFIQYIHNTYDVQFTVEKLSPGNIFSGKLRITDSYYFGEYNVSGYICNKKNLEISTIVLLRESGPSSWIDCLNGTFDLNDDETELIFTDTWIQQDQKNNACKLKYIQKDMFQCLRSAYLHKVKYQSEVAEFEKIWDKTVITRNLNRNALTEMLANTNSRNKETDSSTIKKENIPVNTESLNKSETKIVAKNEDRVPVIDTLKEISNRKVLIKEEIEVSNHDITIEYWDRYTEDGDSVNIILNDKPILKDVLLTKFKKTVNLHLDNQINYLVLDAINVGKEPPNTASITIKDGKKIQNVSLTSTMKMSGALKIILRK